MRQSRVLWLLEREADALIDALREGVQALPLGSWMPAAVPDVRPGGSREAGLLAERRRMGTGAHEHGS